MAFAGWTSGTSEPGVLHAFLDTSGNTPSVPPCATKTCAQRNVVFVARHPKAARTVAARDLLANFRHLCASTARRTRAYWKSTRNVSDHTPPEASSKNHQHRHNRRRHQMQRGSAVADAPANDGSVTRFRWWCYGGGDTWFPIVCAVSVAMLCYLNSLDGEFVHDDMVAVVGNPDVTGESARKSRVSSTSTSLWMTDFWGRAMADPRSHKSYRPLTVLTFR
ncbi:hypothetical protein HPB49_000380 [Dermacentor silvarum]|uniref:Uncharacterized protein n=1 Tax=Dermacentor silvarum TaxID=543639 RepID=A0ACB8DHR7_DERSI|nr:hypothetical protein HPB49_000380 [Dermacentor silvarum]